MVAIYRYSYPMPRRRLDLAAQRRGQRLAATLSSARRSTGRSAETVARDAGVSVETIRSIERGRTPSPEFFTVAAIAIELGVSLDDLYAQTKTVASTPSEGDSHFRHGSYAGSRTSSGERAREV
jgi:transcriptional regulator with XRE-family HTH domain